MYKMWCGDFSSVPFSIALEAHALTQSLRRKTPTNFCCSFSCSAALLPTFNLCHSTTMSWFQRKLRHTFLCFGDISCYPGVHWLLNHLCSRFKGRRVRHMTPAHGPQKLRVCTNWVCWPRNYVQQKPRSCCPKSVSLFFRLNSWALQWLSFYSVNRVFGTSACRSAFFVTKHPHVIRSIRWWSTARPCALHYKYSNRS